MPIDRRFIKKVIITLFVSILVLIILHYKYHFFYFLLRSITPKTNNPENDQKIKELHPVFAVKVARFIKEIEKNGGVVKITSGFRSYEKQSQLYNSGQTPAPPGSSFHNFGQAIDINVNNLVQASSVENWQPIADLGKNKYGFRWGGDFVNNWDKIHFDNGNRYKIEQLQNLYNNNDLVNNNFVKIF